MISQSSHTDNVSSFTVLCEHVCADDRSRQIEIQQTNKRITDESSTHTNINIFEHTHTHIYIYIGQRIEQKKRNMKAFSKSFSQTFFSCYFFYLFNTFFVIAIRWNFWISWRWRMTSRTIQTIQCGCCTRWRRFHDGRLTTQWRRWTDSLSVFIRWQNFLRGFQRRCRQLRF